MKKFNLVQAYKGYINKKDITNVDPECLVPGSQNTLINDAEKVVSRPGMSLYGVANSALTPILGSYEWLTSTNTELPIRKSDTTLEYYYSGAWRTLTSSLSADAEPQFTEWWSSAEAKDLLLMADGTPSPKMWSGGVTTYASSTVNTITKQGTTTWAQDRFLLAGTRQVIIGGITYTYTGGEGTDTLTGVTPDPTAGGHVAGDVVVQALRTHTNLISSSVDVDLISTLKNQVYYADKNRRDVYVSKTTDYTDVSFTAPVRLPGEGALLTLDSPPVAFGIQDEDMYISGGKNDWYKTQFTLSADLSKEDLKIQKLKTGPGQGAVSQASTASIKNSVVFLSNEKTIDTLGRVENINTPQSRPLSDPIKLEILSYSTAVTPHIKYFKNKTYITFPSESRVLIFDHDKGFWNPPQIMGIRRFAIIGGELYGHSSSVKETYKIFDEDTYSDNGSPIDARAAFAYRNYDYPAWGKNFDEWYTEGYIKSNTTLDVTLKYDFGGVTQILEKEINGADSTILFQTASDGSIGKSPFGHNPLGSVTDSPSDLPKFRVKHEIAKQDGFFELQAVYSSYGEDFQWELLRHGGNVSLETEDDRSIKQ